MSKIKRIIWSSGVTANNTKCRLKQTYVNGTAWTSGYYEHTIFTEELSDKDMSIYKSLNIPTWHLDYSGKALTIKMHSLDFGLTDKIVDALLLNQIKWTEVSYET